MFFNTISLYRLHFITNWKKYRLISFTICTLSAHALNISKMPRSVKRCVRTRKRHLKRAPFNKCSAKPLLLSVLRCAVFTHQPQSRSISCTMSQKAVLREIAMLSRGEKPNFRQLITWKIAFAICQQAEEKPQKWINIYLCPVKLWSNIVKRWIVVLY